MKTFLGFDRPVITTMLKSSEPKTLLADISAALAEGTDAFGLQIETMQPEYRTADTFRTLFEAMGEKPVYITNYSRGNISERAQSDDELTEEMLLAMECGATLFDVRGDLFDVQPDEMAIDEKAIEKQMKLIQQIHQMGGEVLISSHTMVYTPANRVMEMALEQKRRGADIAKIVAAADNQEQLDEAFAITIQLKRELGIPSLFLVGGEYKRLHRRIAPLMGSCMFLTVQDGYDGRHQPPMTVVKSIMMNAGVPRLP